ncbi:hypothetical protein ACFQBQ_02360 [Granulicella cerasi]|uniref:Fibronectin type-III domain-containing protein n=2 Tax=Granulicella cerasi TaxID=741063 RepID=A0ABW1Z5P2_9BACT
MSGHRGVYVVPRFGDQTFGDYIQGLTNNDPTWNTYVSPNGTRDYPSVMGCAYCYIKVEYNTDDFSNKPDIKCTIKGKAVYDPRTGETAYSENWALILADIITNTDYGLGSVVNQDQLIAAANICDELVATNGTYTTVYESRYSCNYTWTLDKSIGEVLSDILNGAAGRMSYIDGEWFLFPGTFVGSSASFDSSQLIAAPDWSSQRKFRDKCNRVQGTYIAASYPYNVSGNGYDNTTLTQDNFNLGFQPCSYPAFACDTNHGYAADQYLAEDNNVELVQTLDLSSVLSVAQAQRVAKISLLRNRQQGSGTLVFGAEALILQPNDTFTMTYPQRGWYDKLLEVTKMDVSIVNGDGGAPQIQVALSVQETDPSVYVWNATDELNLHNVEVSPIAGSGVTSPPTNLVLTSSSATALVQPDGTVIPRIELTWDTPADVRVTGIEVQWQLTGATTWNDGGTVSVASNVAYIPAVSGQTYDVRIRSVRSGAQSVWVELDGFTAGLVLATQTQDGFGIGSLVGEAYPNDTAAIVCMPFNANVGQLSLSIFPAGEVTITTDGTVGGSGAALKQQTLYYVYYVDQSYVGGNVTPITTTNKVDFQGKLGYFLVDSIITPYVSSTGTSGSALYYPSSFSDTGTRSTTNPGQAFDGDLSTYAYVSGATTSTTWTTGEGTFQGFPNIALSSASTLTINASGRIVGDGGTVGATITYGSTTATVINETATFAQQAFTVTIPANTPLNTISVYVWAYSAVNLDSSSGPEPVTPSPGSGGSGIASGGTTYEPATAFLSPYEIYVQG